MHTHWHTSSYLYRLACDNSGQSRGALKEVNCPPPLSKVFVSCVHKALVMSELAGKRDGFLVNSSVQNPLETASVVGSEFFKHKRSMQFRFDLKPSRAIGSVYNLTFSWVTQKECIPIVHTA